MAALGRPLVLKPPPQSHHTPFPHGGDATAEQWPLKPPPAPPQPPPRFSRRQRRRRGDGAQGGRGGEGRGGEGRGGDGVPAAAAAPRSSPRESGRGFRCCDCGAVNMAVSLRARSLRHLRIRGKGPRPRPRRQAVPAPAVAPRRCPAAPCLPFPPFLLLRLLPRRQPNALLFPRPRRSQRQRRGERPPRSQPRYGPVAGGAGVAASPSLRARGGAGGKPPAANGLVLRGGRGGLGGRGEARRQRGASARRRWAARRPVVSGAARRWKPPLSPPRRLRGSTGASGTAVPGPQGWPATATGEGSPCVWAEAPRPLLGLFSEEVVARGGGRLQRPFRSGAARAAPRPSASPRGLLAAVAPLGGAGRTPRGSTSAVATGPASIACRTSLPAPGRLAGRGASREPLAVRPGGTHLPCTC